MSIKTSSHDSFIGESISETKVIIRGEVDQNNMESNMNPKKKYGFKKGLIILQTVWKNITRISAYYLNLIVEKLIYIKLKTNSVFFRDMFVDFCFFIDIFLLLFLFISAILYLVFGFSIIVSIIIFLLVSPIQFVGYIFMSKKLDDEKISHSDLDYAIHESICKFIVNILSTIYIILYTIFIMLLMPLFKLYNLI